jgi:hypothetical protein
MTGFPTNGAVRADLLMLCAEWTRGNSGRVSLVQREVKGTKRPNVAHPCATLVRAPRHPSLYGLARCATSICPIQHKTRLPLHKYQETAPHARVTDLKTDWPCAREHCARVRHGGGTTKLPASRLRAHCARLTAEPLRRISIGAPPPMRSRAASAHMHHETTPR